MLETRYIGTLYVDFGSMHVDTVTLFNRPADLRKYFFKLNLNYFHFLSYLFSLIVV